MDRDANGERSVRAGRPVMCPPGPARTPDGHATAGGDPDALTAVRAVADAVLYEGYLLYPYRRSSGKNRVRWQFGVLAPRDWVERSGVPDTTVAGSADGWHQQTECLAEAADDATVHVRLRFLQWQRRSVEVRGADGTFRPVDEAEIDGRRYLGFDEAVPREFEAEATIGQLRRGPITVPIEAPGGTEVEACGDTGAGRLVRQRWPVAATVRMSVAEADAPFRLLRLRVVTENGASATSPTAARPDVLRHSLVATHSIMELRGGSFLSLLDPPEWAASAAAACRNVHTFPVLAGGTAGRRLVLSSPILLYDDPQVAPESPGDLFDAAEIDEILSLRTLTLTDAEKSEARATDPRAAAIIDRVDGIPDEVMSRLHGAVRSLRPAGAPASTDTRGTPDPAVASPAGRPAASTGTGRTPWWEPGGDRGVSPAHDTVLVDGVPVARGSRVRLRPRRGGTDAHDMFLAGRTARVHAVLLDVDGSRQVAVTVDDDPAAELHEWYGRFHHFAPEEIEPVDEPRAAP